MFFQDISKSQNNFFEYLSVSLVALFIYLYVFLRGIQTLKESQNQLKYLEFALNRSSIVSLTNEKGDIQFVNRNFTELSEYSSEDLIGKNHRILKSGFHKIDFYKNLWQTILAGKVWHGEYQNKSKNGKFYWVEGTIVPYMNAQKKIIKFIAIQKNITLRKQMELDLIKAKEEALAAARAKSSFLSNMRHEIRTPMNIILGMADLLSETNLTCEQRKFVDLFRKSGDTLLNTINDILDISKIESGMTKIDNHKFN